MDEKKVTWRAQSFNRSNDGSSFAFNATEIIFQNRNGIANIVINDTWVLSSGDPPLYLRCNPGEVDISEYKFNWPGGAANENILQVFYRS